MTFRGNPAETPVSSGGSVALVEPFNARARPAVFDLDRLANTCLRCGYQHRTDLHYAWKSAASALGRGGDVATAARAAHLPEATVASWLQERRFQFLVARARRRAVRRAARLVGQAVAAASADASTTFSDTSRVRARSDVREGAVVPEPPPPPPAQDRGDESPLSPPSLARLLGP